MRLLSFNVNEQTINKDASCNFGNIVKGTRGYLFAGFTFDASWSGLTKMAVFNDTYPVRLDSDGKCQIPDCVLDADSFTVRITGLAKNKKVTTNNITVMQVR